MQPDRTSRQILIHGLALVLAGLAWGFFVPQTPYPRLALGAHIQFTSAGLLLILVAILLVTIPHRLGRWSLGALVLATWLTWPMVLSEVANAWWGTTKMLPIAAGQAGATGGQPWQETVVQLTHAVAGLSLIVAWTLLLVGFVRRPAAEDPGG